MNNTISVTIDASVLAVPEPSGSSDESIKDEAFKYVETILHWAKLMEEPWAAVFMSEEASASLFEDNMYPLRDQLQTLFSSQGIVEYDVNTVAKVIDQLLQTTPSFESFFAIRDVLFEDLSVQPDIRPKFSGLNLNSELDRCIVLIAILREKCPERRPEHSLILRKAPNETIRVKTLVHEMEHHIENLQPLPTPPDYFEGNALVCDDFWRYVRFVNEVTYFLNPEISTDDVQTAMRIGVYKSRLQQGVEPEWDDIPNYKIGQKFINSLRRIPMAEQLASKVIRAMIETLEQINMGATHALRNNATGNSPQKIREHDGAKAWRRDIDRDCHLHYWLSDNGLVEFAWISYPHNDFCIPE